MRKIILIMAIFLAGCGNKDIAGQVFIVTQGMDNIKLGLVDVLAIPQDAFNKYISAQHSKGLELQKALAPELEAAKKEAHSEADLIAVDAARKAAEKSLEAHSRGLVSDAVYQKASDKVDSLYDVINNKVHYYHTLDDKYKSYDSAEYYFEGLPKPLATAKTDADGKFTLHLTKGKYVIAAKSNRKTFNSTENYYWLVSIDTASQNTPLLLSNDNFIESKCNDCAKLPL